MQQCLALGSPLLTAAEQARRAYGASVTPLRECSATCIGWRNSRPFRSSDVQLGAALPDRIPPYYLPLGFSFPGLPSPILLRKYSYQTCTFVILTKRRDALTAISH